jgi:hypothetical protein
MHHTHHFLAANYSPSSATDFDLYKEIQTFIYVFLITP